QATVARGPYFRHGPCVRVAAANAPPQGRIGAGARQAMNSRTEAAAELKDDPKAGRKPDQAGKIDQAEEKPEPQLLQLGQFLPHPLNVLSSLVSQALTRVYAQHGIGIPEWRVLVSLGQFGVMTGKAIGARTHMHKTKVSRAVAELERRKFLTRRTNRADL